MNSTLLLNCSYEPLEIISWKAAVKLISLGKVEIVKEYDQEIRSPSITIKMPAVARLTFKFKSAKRKIKFSRVNVYTRDRFSCQYCGEAPGVKELTFDHVIPRVAGGKTNWENIVTCCKPCNTKKGSRALEKVGFKLTKKPEKPNWLPFFAVKTYRKKIPKHWEDFIFWSLRD